MSSPLASANITGEMNVRSPTRFAKNVRQVCDHVGGRPRRYRETVRSEMAIPSFSNSRGSTDRPTDNSPHPYAESDLDTMNRYAVFPDASRNGASIDVLLRVRSADLDELRPNIGITGR